VLVVEDNDADARYLQETLGERAETNFVCEHATDLASARRALGETSFDVILLDLSLPDAIGIVTVEEMRRHAAGTPIVVLTGLRDDRVALSALHAGAQD
jgi:DNA-binding response OmpR family regulator